MPTTASGDKNKQTRAANSDIRQPVTQRTVFIARQHAMHAERDMFLPFLSVCPSNAPPLQNYNGNSPYCGVKLYTWSGENARFLTEIVVYLRNSAR